MKYPFLLFLLAGFQSNAQVTISATVPVNTPADADIYISGTFNNWNPNDINHKLVKSGNGYAITLPVSTGDAEYRFTRGTWAAAEGDSIGDPVPNRRFTYAPLLLISNAISGWEDLKPAPRNRVATKLPNVKLLDQAFVMPQLNRTRRVWIYLPRDYDSSGREYPVIYMQDGQNLFDNAIAASTEWGVDETLAAKEKSGDKGTIVVAVEHGGQLRTDEYAPYASPEGEGGQGGAYAAFMAYTLKPFIDSVYRTYPDKNNTTIMGSGLGGLISLYTALSYPEVFGKVVVFSPVWSAADSLSRFIRSGASGHGIQYYIVASGNTTRSMDNLVASLRKQGNMVTPVIRSDGAASEWFWKREFGTAYDWLSNQIDPSVPGQLANAAPEDIIVITPNPASKRIYFNVRVDEVQIVGKIGQPRIERKNVRTVDITSLPNGEYSVVIKYGSRYYNKRLQVNSDID